MWKLPGVVFTYGSKYFTPFSLISVGLCSTGDVLSLKLGSILVLFQAPKGR